MVIDIHTHCFPDLLACRAVAELACKDPSLRPHTAGTVQSLLSHMEHSGVDCSVLQPVATRPEQVPGINAWAKQACRHGIMAFGAIHPESANPGEVCRLLLGEGFLGVKLHPDYQHFYADYPDAFPLYEALQQAGLVVLFHAGVDIGLPYPVHGNPARLRAVADRFPGLTIIAAHMGGFRCWNEVQTQLLGTRVLLDTSYARHELPAEQFLRLIKIHGADKILMGSDSPWGSQAEELAFLRGLPLAKEETDAITGGNAKRLLKL